MIVTRSPLRISLGGGGTDLPSYYSQFGGYLVAAAIDKYVYVALNRRFVDRLLLKHSEIEEVSSVEQISHPIIRECLLHTQSDSNLEITSFADTPAGTGLGSSGSFTTALLKALYTDKQQSIQTHELAEEACLIEIDRLHEPIGKQDQYIAAFGGLTSFTFEKNGAVDVQPLALSKETISELEDHLVLFFTGFSRSASDILQQQRTKSLENDATMLENLHFTKELGFKSKFALESGDLEQFAELMNVHWEHKRVRSGGMSNETIDQLYRYALQNGALGGKLIGAGGGGFLLFYTQNRESLIAAFARKKIKGIPVRFDFQGTCVIAK